MLVFYHRTGLEVTPGKQVTYAIIIAYIVFKTVRQKFIYFNNFHHILRGKTLTLSKLKLLKHLNLHLDIWMTFYILTILTLKAWSIVFIRLNCS